MATNEQTDVVVSGYNKRPLPTTLEALRVYLSLELQALEKTLRSLEESALQVADAAPSNPKKGMLRYAVSPWDPLGDGSTGLVVYDGSSWTTLSSTSLAGITYNDL